MSITITVRPKDAASGGKDQTIEGDGAIDTKKEAEAALAFLPEKSTDTVVVGKDSYTREQLIAIRDGKKDTKDGGNGVEGGVNHGVAVKGFGSAGVTDPAHSGGGASLSYVAGIPILDGDTRLFFEPSVGFRFGGGSMDYQLPGGGDASSSFLSYGAVLGAGLRLVPPILDHRLWAGLGLDFGISGFSSPDSEMVSLPPSCTPGDFGRGECEPGAGPRSGNAGTTGLYNPRVGNSRGASGVGLDVDIPLTVGVDVARGDWGNLGLFAQFIPGYSHLIPSDGDGFGFWRVGGGGGAVVRFGGSAVEKKAVVAPRKKPEAPADKDKDGVSDAEDKCPDVKGTKENGGCPPYEAKVTSTPASVKAEDKFLVGLTVGSTSRVRVSFKSVPDGTLNNSNSVFADEGNSKSEFKVPAELKSGKYKLVVTFEDLATHVKKVEERDIVIVENVTAELPPSFAPNQPAAIQNARVKGMEKLEGVTYVIEGFGKDGKSVGALDSKTSGKSVTLNEKSGQLITLESPDKKGFQKDVTYRVRLLNKDGHEVWTGEFVIGVAPPAPKGVGGRKRL
jgi:hypothetical protein